MPKELLLAIIADASEDGDFCDAASYGAHFDGILREQDVDQTQIGDLSFLGGKWTATLGDPTRGESVKTGVDQGVTFEASWVNRIISSLVRGRADDEKVFVIGMEDYRKGFGRRLRKRGVPNVKGPQIIRHSGAADMVYYAEEDDNGVLERARRRGRWSDIRSCQVYQKLHLLRRMMARLTADVLRYGAYLAQNVDLLAEVWIEEFEKAGRPLGSRKAAFDKTRTHRLRPPLISSCQTGTVPRSKRPMMKALTKRAVAIRQTLIMSRPNKVIAE